jgi:HlyD family secretion protein
MSDKMAAAEVFCRSRVTEEALNQAGEPRLFNVRISRLRAERDDGKWDWPPSSLAEREQEPELLEMFLDERSLYDSRKASRAGQKQQLAERISQLAKRSKAWAASAWQRQRSSN